MSNLSLLKKEALQEKHMWEDEYRITRRYNYQVEGWELEYRYDESKKTGETLSINGDVYMIEDGKKTYSADIYSKSEEMFGPASKIQVNWAAYGSQDLTELSKFIDTLRVAEEVARALENKLIFKNEEDF